MTVESSSRIARAVALLFAVTAVPPIIAKEKRRKRRRKTPASVEKTKGQPFWIALRTLPLPLLLRRSAYRDCVFPGANVLQPTIGGAGSLAGARPFNALHLPGAACNLILIPA
jgi:hypothetical protein